MELCAFSSQFAVGIVNYARKTINHGYFIAITFAGSLGRYLNSRLSGLVFKQLPRDSANVRFLGTRQMLMHENPWVIPIF